METRKITANFEPSQDESFAHGAYLDTRLKEINGKVAFIGNDYNQFSKKIVNDANQQSAKNSRFHCDHF